MHLDEFVVTFVIRRRLIMYKLSSNNATAVLVLCVENYVVCFTESIF